ncbi:MAG: DUF4340 domain-containing protein [Firmicutes bacterium]|nr:DUF4340 domain-containing protein [Bacillota bacterium]
MPTRARWLLLILVSGALAVALVVMSRERMPTQAIHEPDPQDLQLLAFDAKDAVEIIIERNDGLAARIRRRPADGATSEPASDAREESGFDWEQVQPEGSVADRDLIQAAVSALSDLRAYRRIDPIEALGEGVNPAAFGLDPPRIRLTVLLAGPQGSFAEAVLLVGEATPVVIGDFPTYYVRLPGSEDIYAAGGPGLALIDLLPESVLEHDTSLDADAAAHRDIHDG